ncbi:MAG: glycine cleavage system aminomethyltransferase GcvT, partial [Deinococcus-Thermus bacterium]|nr:glycine cleavage system aminomethyltransferase GcvT [Deinococcota bacterium]
MASETDTLARTPLNALHRERGGRMVPFAGWDMPVQFAGTLAEHAWTRESAGLFDVSHMGQVVLEGEDAARALESLVPQAVAGLKPGRQRYAFFTNDTGGLLDDLMIATQEERLFLVVNAARAKADLAHLRAGLPDVRIVQAGDRALLALQGPKAEVALARIEPSVADMRFMDHRVATTAYGELWISRS